MEMGMGPPVPILMPHPTSIATKHSLSSYHISLFLMTSRSLFNHTKYLQDSIHCFFSILGNKIRQEDMEKRGDGCDSLSF